MRPELSQGGNRLRPGLTNNPTLAAKVIEGEGGN